MQYWIIKNREDVERVLSYIKDWANGYDFEKPLTLVPKPYTNPRSLSQNALLHKWFQEMADYFSSRGVEIDAEKAKSLMKHKFLGTEDIVINKTVIQGQLKQTSKLDKGDMQLFMDLVYNWAVDHGVTLSIPEDSEYMRLRQ